MIPRVFGELKPLIRWSVRHAALVLFVAAIVTAVSLFFASRLHVDADFTQLVPSDFASVQALEKLRETVGGESDVSIAIESPSFEANVAFAEALIASAIDLRARNGNPYFKDVEYRREVELLEHNGLYFATLDELDTLHDAIEDYLVQEKMKASPLFIALEDEDSAGENLLSRAEHLLISEYPVSEDGRTHVVRFFPTIPQTDIGTIRHLYQDLEGLIEELRPTGHHPEMTVTLAGRLYRQLVEVETITKDVSRYFGVGAGSVLFVVVLYFAIKTYLARVGFRYDGRVLCSVLARIPAMAVLIGLPLLMSLSWTLCIAYFIYDALNMMTSTLGLILFGLGIDYGVHYFGRYAEERARGRSIEDAAAVTFGSTGQAIAVSAGTTAVALYVLNFGQLKGFSQFGFIAGTGILFAFLAMTILMAALTATLERLRWLDLTRRSQGDKSDTVGRFPAPRAILAIGGVSVLVALLSLPDLAFEYDFGKLEPTYTEYNRRRDIIHRVYPPIGTRRNPAFVVADSPSEIGAIRSALDSHAKQDSLSPTVGDMMCYQDRVPLSASEQKAKLERIGEIRNLLHRPLVSAMVSNTERSEAGRGNAPVPVAGASELLARLRKAAGAVSPPGQDGVPSFISRPFTSRQGEIGTFLIVYPSVGVSDGLKSIAFSEDVGTIRTAEGRVYHAGSTALVAADLLKLMRIESPWMISVALALVALLMFANFGSLVWAGLGLVPLLVGLLSMLLVTDLLSLTLNFYNIVVLVAIVGIGNDAGAHLTSRYREEGEGSILLVIRSTGEHIAVGAMTTIIGFAGLLCSFHPGLRTMGQLAVIGIGTTLVTALVFLPALLQCIEDRSRVRIHTLTLASDKDVDAPLPSRRSRVA